MSPSGVGNLVFFFNYNRPMWLLNYFKRKFKKTCGKITFSIGLLFSINPIEHFWVKQERQFKKLNHQLNIKTKTKESVSGKKKLPKYKFRNHKVVSAIDAQPFKKCIIIIYIYIYVYLKP